MKAHHTKVLSQRGSVVVVLAVLLLIVSGGLIGAYFFMSSQSGATAKVPEPPAPEPAPAKSRTAPGSVVMRFAGHEQALAWSEISKGEAIDDQRALARLRKLKQALDVVPLDAYLDLEGQKVVREKPGHSLDVYASLAALHAARIGRAAVVDLVGVELPPKRTVADLGIDDISTVLAEWTTKFSLAEKSRNDNLKLAASRLNGHVLKPGELFSFNDVVGARSYENGYKIAHVISAGEMVDGLAGGTCQISTTLFGAAFFAGIEIVKAIPHSRPSTYQTMGLDATVTYPHTDLKLRNNYPFPVVIHYRVARGESVVRILGKERPYDKIAFERVIKKKLPFETVTREDPEKPVGSAVVTQEGFPGYKLYRYRRFYKDGKEVKKERWHMQYRPVTEYVQVGTNPDPNLPRPKQAKGHGPHVEGNTRIVR